jgi:transcriptional regulator with GAF, ATPase, and Fis domain
MHVQVGSEAPSGEGAIREGAESASALHAVERPLEFETQHKLLLLETLFDAGRSLGALPDESSLVEDVLGRAVGVLDAARGYLATFGDGGERRAEARVGFARRLPDSVVADDAFLTEVARADAPVRQEHARLLRTAVSSVLGVAIRAGGRTVGVLVLADKEIRRGGRAPFDDEDARFLSSLAGLAGMAIENRRHLQRLTRERERLEEENRRLLDATGRSAAGRTFVGESLGARRVLDLVARVAPSRTSVLITGESGTGKELVARMIHARSDRADGPFIAINCAALPETLLESELFGIERGVATGVDARAGRLEAANGGTLFLDEIGDMPASVQAKLLRVLQERQIERVGGRSQIPMDVRVIAATNAPLSSRISSGQFREDLYYRLRVVEIALPPLRERREDIPKLARHFLERFAAAEGREPLVLDREAFAALVSHEFLGNVRELENLLEGAATLSRGGVIRIEDLQWLPGRALGSFSDGGPTGSDELSSLRLLEERHIRKVMKLAGGNKSRAARMLGISRRTLYRKKHLEI